MYELMEFNIHFMLAQRSDQTQNTKRRRVSFFRLVNQQVNE